MNLKPLFLDLDSNELKYGTDNNNGIITAINWADLVQLRDNSQLTPGLQYRIIDYETTTAQANTGEAKHQFDIIVIADSVDSLNENARACKHEGDTYFHDSIASWVLKYCLDNDTDRFAWANDVKGKGVIFYMKDEYNNEAFYDFKNILFARYKITNIYDQNNNPIQHDLIGTYGEAITDDQNHVMVEVDLQDSIMCYTFSYTDNGDIIDASNYFGFNGYTPNLVNSNSIGIYGEYSTTPPDLAIKLGLPYIVFLSNINGSRFFGIKIGFVSGHLTFGNICHDVEIENNTHYCIFGEECNETNLASNCDYNVFGNDCRKNTLSEECRNNIFNSHISYNTIMSKFESNLLGSYIKNSTFFNGINHCNITGGSENSRIQFVQILNGVANQTIGFISGVGYTQVACLDSSNNLIVGTPTITV